MSETDGAPNIWRFQQKQLSLQPKVRVYLNYDIMYLEPFDKHTNYLLTEINQLN